VSLPRGLPDPTMSFWQLLKEDWIAHERDWTRPGFRAVAVHRLGNLQLDTPRPLHRCGRFLHRVLYRWVRNRYSIELPYAVELGRRPIIEHQGAIIIHGFARLGDDCIVRQGTTIGNRYRDRPLDAPRLGDRVDVGAGAQILGAVSVGDDARVGANAVVIDDVPAGHTAVGVPAVARPTKP
jgi:serine O-acetyltransferase